MEASALVVQMDELLFSRQRSCQCTRKELRWGVKVNGAKYYKWQCVDCLKCGQEVSKLFAKGRESQIVDVDETDYMSPERIQERTRARREQVSLEWWSKYNAYLLTPKWRAKREAVMRRDNGVCQACLSARASDVHHLTYDHLFDEPLFDLIAVCRPCHDRITAMDRAKRGA